MSKSAHVIDGEASESESEIEIAKSVDTSRLDETQSSFVIAGEAPESDEENVERAEPRQDINITAIPTEQHHPAATTHKSLLHEKLWDSNVQLRATVVSLLRNATESAAEKLSVDSLLEVQELMRKTNMNLARAAYLLNKTESSLDIAKNLCVLPNVKIKINHKM